MKITHHPQKELSTVRLLFRTIKTEESFLSDISAQPHNKQQEDSILTQVIIASFLFLSLVLKLDMNLTRKSSLEFALGEASFSPPSVHRTRPSKITTRRTRFKSMTHAKGENFELVFSSIIMLLKVFLGGTSKKCKNFGGLFWSDFAPFKVPF